MQVKVEQGGALAAQLGYIAYKAGCTWSNGLEGWVDLGALLQHPNPEVRGRWQRPSTKGVGNIPQGHGDTKGKDVCQFVPKHEIPHGGGVTYPRAVVDYRSEKIGNPYRTCTTAGYGGGTMVNSADYVIIKTHWDSVLSSPGYKYAVMGAGNMYLGTDLPTARFVRSKLGQVPTATQGQYQLQNYVDQQGYVYVRISKAWYGLKE